MVCARYVIISNITTSTINRIEEMMLLCRVVAKGGGGGGWFTLLAGFSPFCHFFFFTETKGGWAPWAPTLDLPLVLEVSRREELPISTTDFSCYPNWNDSKGPTKNGQKVLKTRVTSVSKSSASQRDFSFSRSLHQNIFKRVYMYSYWAYRNFTVRKRCRKDETFWSSCN